MKVYEAMRECERNGTGDVIDWVLFWILWATSMAGQARRTGLDGDDDDIGAAKAASFLFLSVNISGSHPVSFQSFF